MPESGGSGTAERPGAAPAARRVDAVSAARRVDAALTAWNERRERFGRWRRALADELAVLPDTLRRFREGVGNFSLVAERVAVATEALERAQRLYEASGVADATRRIDEAASLVERQAAVLREATPGLERVEAAVGEFNRALSGMAERLPGWWPVRPPWPPGPRR